MSNLDVPSRRTRPGLVGAASLALILASAAGAQTFSVSGAFEYEDKGWGYSGWTGTDGIRPIRRADVTVLNNASSAVLGTGTTGEAGSFSIACAGTGVLDVVVRVDGDTALNAGFQRIRVTTESNVEYSAFSPVFAGHDTSTDLDVGTTTVLKVTSGGNEANPFNLLEMGVESWEYITGPAGGGPVGTTIRLYWPSGSGSFASGAGAHMADDDGYDDAVILHEIGHVVHNQYSDSDSPGGSHFFGDSDQDPRLSLGEGWGTAWAGIVMDQEIVRQAIYLDADGSLQNGGVQLRARLETAEPYAGDAFGEADEVAVACTLFDLIDWEGSPDQSAGSDDDAFGSTTLIGAQTRHVAWWDVFTGAMALQANVTVNDAWNGWFATHGSSGLHVELQDLFDLRDLHFFNDGDEPNDLSSTPVPVAVNGLWSGNRTLYAGFGNPPAPGEGDHDWYAVELVKGSVIDLETRYPDGAADANTACDTQMDLYDGALVKKAEAESGGVGRNAKISGFLVPATGTWSFRVRSVHTYRTYGRYDFRGAYQFENFRPVVDAGPLANPDSVWGGTFATLSVSASDPNSGQVLSYAWTPLDGGTIVGSGPIVAFEAPLVTTPTLMEVSVVVSDDLGAESEAAVVTVTVRPLLTKGPHVAAQPYGAGPPGPLGTPFLSFPLTGPTGTLDMGLPGVGVLLHAIVVAGGDVRRAPFDRRAVTPDPDLLIPVVPAPDGALAVRLPVGGLFPRGVPFYVQVVGRDARGPVWSDVLEVLLTD